MDTIHLQNKGKTLMVAHRGCSGLEKENTMPAFVAAGNRSYYGIETDVHKTADGKYICFHDDTTKRVAIDDMVVEETSYDTLRALPLTDKEGKRGRIDLRMPSLEEYINVCKYYDKYAVLELKNAFEEEDIYEICAIIDSLGHLEKTIFISFSYENLVYLRKKYPTQAAQFLISTFPDDLIDHLIHLQRPSERLFQDRIPRPFHLGGERGVPQFRLPIHPLDHLLRGFHLYATGDHFRTFREPLEILDQGGEPVDPSRLGIKIHKLDHFTGIFTDALPSPMLDNRRNKTFLLF